MRPWFDPPTVLPLAMYGTGLAALSAAGVRSMMAAGLLDRPDGARKAHDRPTPKGGGVGIVAAFLAGIGFLYAVAGFAPVAHAYLLGIVVASAAMAGVALLDDAFDFPFAVKLVAQIAAAALALASGVYVRTLHLPFLAPFDLGWIGPPATLVWILFVTNALNFIDGLNGLAAGTALIVSVFLAYIGATQHGRFLALASLTLAAGLAGFLPFNFPKARIFMGDVGSQFCGFMLAMLGVVASRFDLVPLSLMLTPMLLAGVLWDVAFTLVRRLLAGEDVTRAHNTHLYQLAARSGMDARLVALVHWGFAAYGGVCCLLFLHTGAGEKPLIVALPLLPQLVWTGYVRRRARRAGLGFGRAAAPAPQSSAVSSRN